MLKKQKVGRNAVARKPEQVDIRPQRMGFEFSNQVPRYWAAKNYTLSHTMNALSVLFPQGEHFFVASVRQACGGYGARTAPSRA